MAVAPGRSGDGPPALRRRPEVWTVPNIISMVRLAGVPLFLWLVLVPEADVLALVVLMVAGFSDWLDGYLARRLDQMSELGRILDPVADRLYILAAVIGLLLRDIIPWWVAVILPARDLFLWCLVPFLRRRGYSSLPVHYLGKAATAALLYAFPLLFLGDGAGVLAALALVFGWAFAVWGIGLYWWAGLLYAWQVRGLYVEDTRAPALESSTGPTAGPPPEPTTEQTTEQKGSPAGPATAAPQQQPTGGAPAKDAARGGAA